MKWLFLAAFLTASSGVSASPLDQQKCLEVLSNAHDLKESFSDAIFYHTGMTRMFKLESPESAAAEDATSAAHALKSEVELGFDTYIKSLSGLCLSLE
ncbi:hypothetical protein [Pseudophaeobacter sp. C1-32P7]|uniref:hypothetical protein n=1 Tax=Pseudophaeobacter sp. C1-32P7 TaxID=3098142 RepID=UPI0034D6A5D3